MNVVDDRIEGFLRDGVVLSGAELRGQTAAQNSLANGLSQNSNTQCHPCQLEGISEDIKVPGSEDEDDDRGKGDGCGPRVLPR